MAKKIILALIILILIASIAFFTIMPQEDTVNIYIDGENVTVDTHTFSNINSERLNSEICDYTIEVMNDTTSDVNTLRQGVNAICSKYGLENPTINIDSSIGPDQIPVMAYVDGTSMLPTLQDGQSVLFNKTHNVDVGDIVVAESDEYGGIIKRVGEIDGDQVYLESDNKEVTYEYINDSLYEVSGITTWVNINDINGVVIDY